jgi:hypothetical protein
MLTWLFLVALIWAVFAYRNYPPQLRSRRGSALLAAHEARSEHRPDLEPVIPSPKVANTNEAQHLVSAQDGGDFIDTVSHSRAALSPVAKANSRAANRTATPSSNHQRLHRNREKASVGPVPTAKLSTVEVSPDEVATQDDLFLQSEADSLPDFIFVPFEDVIKDQKLEGWEDRWISYAEYDVIEQGRLVEPLIDFVYLCKTRRITVPVGLDH